MLSKVVYILLLLVTTIGYGQVQNLSWQEKQWEPNDFPAGIHKVTAYEYKITKRGKVKRDSTLLYRQEYDPADNRIFGQNHWVAITIGYNDYVTSNYTYYDFEKFYDESGEIVRSTETTEDGEVRDVTNQDTASVVTSVDSQGRTLTEKIYRSVITYQYNDAGFAKSIIYALPGSGMPVKTVEVYNAKGYATSVCHTFTTDSEECDYYEYTYQNDKVATMTQTNCRNQKLLSFYKYNSSGLLTEEKVTFEGKTTSLMRYYYN
ncbi:MAG: hypothetical protein EOP54_18545 [Sphingobacteriales bacterium]|nr:MAG: hypothetical protein EOP54_18545 [Sphingobacteriales bacterium]